MNYLVFSTDATKTCFDYFNDVCNFLNARLGYPSTDLTTLTYAIPIHHPNENDYRVAMIIEDQCIQWLTDEQKATIQTQSQLNADGWFLVLKYPGAQ